MIHNNKQVKIKTIQFEAFLVSYYEHGTMGYEDFSVIEDKRRTYWLHDRMVNKFFVIEALPDDTQNQCEETDVTDILSRGCHGPIRLRQLTKDDLN